MMTDMMYDRWAARESAGRRAARCTSAATTTPAPHPPLVSLGLDLMTRSGDGRRERQGQRKSDFLQAGLALSFTKLCTARDDRARRGAPANPSPN